MKTFVIQKAVDYQQAAIKWLSNSFEFSYRLDLPTRPNRPYRLDFQSDLRKICFGLNNQLLGKKSFKRLLRVIKSNETNLKQDQSKVRDQSDLDRQRFFFVWVEEGNETDIENHFHLLFHMPADFRRDYKKLKEIEVKLKIAFNEKGYKPLIQRVISNVQSVDYNCKMLREEFESVKDPRWGFSHQ